MPPPPQTDAARLQAALAVLGWSQAELARRLAVSPQTVRSWVSGRRAVPGPVLTWLEGKARDWARTPDLPDGWSPGDC